MPADSKTEVIDEILRRRVSAIIRTDDERLASDAMKAAVTGGFRMVEFTLTTPNALRLIADFRKDDALLVGAGTVMSPAQAHAAVEAGAQFVVSPVCDPEVIARTRELDVVSIPGTFTPTEMITAHRCGADFVKLFPAPANVADYVASVLGPLPYLRIFPTNGVTVENFTEILRAGAAGVGFVEALFRPEDMSARNFAAIERCAAEIIRRLDKRDQESLSAGSGSRTP
ncbi:MAG: bifunctional 4-hydroxy-2-oxoglutarate aldolase/2-dehydro-3-deoxy-phosphogluconate aldolase [Planctomycetota bacterium]